MAELIRDELIRYSKQLKLEEISLAGQQKLKQARVLCVGAGGLGSPLLLYLAASGVGQIGIMDEDTLALDNLPRQVIYQTNHIGQRKSELAKAQLLLLNPHSDITTYVERLTAENAKNIIAEYDIVADCTDNFATRYLINDTCFALDKPYVFASIAQYQGQCSVFLGKKKGCYRCLFPLVPDENAVRNCNDAGVLNVLPGLLGVIQATEILKWIVGIGNILAGRLLMVDALKMEFREFLLEPDASCSLCG
jgi:molybdopterin/thiamine biosynthesis adenylyltransferase